MAIDPQIALNSAGTNALMQGAQNQMGQFSNFQNALIQNRALAAQQALGQAYKDNTDSQGNTNLQGVRAELAQSQGGSYALSDGTAGNTISQGQGFASMQGTQLANSASKLGIFAHTLQGLITKPNVSQDDVQQAGAGLVNAGIFTPQQMQQELSNVPPDSNGIKTWLSTHQAAAGQALNQIGIQYPTGSVSTGGQTQFGSFAPGYAPNAGAFTPTSSVNNTVGPETAAGQTQVQTPQGPMLRPNADILRQEGYGGLLPPGANKYPWQFNGAPGGSPAGGGAGPAPSASNGGTPPGGAMVPIGMAPGAAGAQATQQDAGSQALATLQGATASSPARRTILNNMLSDLSNFTSGPFAGHVRGAEALINNVTGAGINTSGISAAQEFDAAAPKIAAAQGQALGVLTNDKLHAELMAVPNSSKQPDTNKNLVYQMLGNEDALSAAQQAFQKTGQPPGNYLSWASSISPFFDPRAYQLLRMPPAQQQQQLQQMQKAGILNDFKANVNKMAAAGLIQMPQQQPTAPANGP